MKWIQLLLRFCIGITFAMSAYYLIRMVIERTALKKGFGDISNPFGGPYLNPFLISLGVSIFLIILLFVTNKQSR